MRKWKSKKGMTLVEVIMAFVGMLLLMSIFAGSITFSNKAMLMSERISKQAAEASALLRKNTSPTTEGAATYQFTVVGGTGTNVLFEVKVNRISRETVLTDGTKIKFYQFQPIEKPKGGG